MRHESANQFINCLPAIFRLQINDDRVGAKEIVQIHFSSEHS